ncbi:GNAT family N-acetyltransferase [Spirabiliibacterium falconis]|uniref:GNAT family N-acetyltransferase n=1 Tax=Spirabiliibacterium falconis TaxID=572023 RepID=UPI001AACE812|nr:GNAT family N-acetyltransferase [Spirabiliibacterium falconis]MBE2894301.1 GNAT family N-acetyltransferase [Spirabiliibacterium falconis]
MNIKKLTDRSSHDVALLVALWEQSVIATHHFLDTNAIAEIKNHVPTALLGVECLAVAMENEKMIGFIGINGDKIEMLFVHPDYFGKGFGKNLMDFALKNGVSNVVVNAQNPNALAFYQKMGFQIERTSKVDEQGQPYPIIYLKKA